MNELAKRKNKGGNFRVNVGTSFSHAVFCEIETLAQKFELGNAQVVRELFLRGLAAYKRDGKLHDPEDGNNELADTTSNLAESCHTSVAA